MHFSRGRDQNLTDLLLLRQMFCSIASKLEIMTRGHCTIGSVRPKDSPLCKKGKRWIRRRGAGLCLPPPPGLRMLFSPEKLPPFRFESAPSAPLPLSLRTIEIITIVAPFIDNNFSLQHLTTCLPLIHPGEGEDSLWPPFAFSLLFLCSF